MSSKKDNRLAWGVSLLTFGCLFLFRELNILPYSIAKYLFDPKAYLLIIGVIFLIFHSNKSIGWVLIIVGLLLQMTFIISLLSNFSDYIWPALLIIAGIILVFGVKKGK